MSDLNDDLLNYEIGEVDDNDLIGADEDELLLSDEESIPVKISKEQEADLLGEDDVEVETASKSTSGTEIIGSSLSVPSNVEKEAKPSKQIAVKTPVKTDLPPPAPTRTSPRTRPTLKRSTTTTNTTTAVKAAKVESPKSTSSGNDARTKASSTHKPVDEVKILATPSPKSHKSEESTEQISDVASDVASDAATCGSETGADTNSTTITDESDRAANYSESLNILQSQETISSQVTSEEASFDNELNYESLELDGEDSDEDSERRNPKTCVERSIDPPTTSDPNRPPPHQGPFNRQQRGGGHFMNSRGRFPGPYHPYRTPSNENFNPQFHPQFRSQNPMMGGRPPLPGGQFDPRTGGPMHSFHRMPMHPGMPQPPRLPLPPSPHGHPIQIPPGGAGPPFRMFNPNSGAPGQILPRGASPLFRNMGPFQPQPGFPNRHPGNMVIHRPQLHPQQVMHNSGIGPSQISQPQLPPVARKVLINPNFKGGVQAATNQLMKDTMGNVQFLAANNEAELLRQQEAFINQNRMHIEKRRRSRDRSVDRDRERSYSPVRRRPYDRERDGRKPYNSYRGGDDNRGRRGGSREHDNDNRNSAAGSRRSGSFDRETDRKGNKTEEDEETRAYRMEIEKQKAMREKILRDKEMRRRKAAEDIKSKDDEKKPSEETAQKLTPIIVTTKKIISLKKKPNDQSAQQAGEVVRPATGSQLPQKQIRQIGAVRKLPTATILPETKRMPDAVTAATTAVVKPVVKRPHILVSNDLEDYDEDELLADSPPASPVKVIMKALPKPGTGGRNSARSAIPTTVVNSGVMSNRRVVVRTTSGDTIAATRKLIISSSKGQTGGDIEGLPREEDTIDVDEIKSIVQSTASSQHKGIFDRLDKKLVGVNDAAKRKIQRIVINNSE